MPTTDPCVLGAENAANIKALKETLEDFRTEVRIDIKAIQIGITKLTNHYSERPRWLVVLVITSLASFVCTLATYIIMAG